MESNSLFFYNFSWHCPNPNCNNINFSRRNRCNRCGTLRPNMPLEQNEKDFDKPRYNHVNPNFFRVPANNSYEKDYKFFHKHHHYERSRSKSQNSRSRSRSNNKNLYRFREGGMNTNYFQPRNFQFNNNRRNFGSMGLFQEGDWKCEVCQNINFSWRTLCNKCKHPKKESNQILSSPNNNFNSENKNMQISNNFQRQFKNENFNQRRRENNYNYSNRNNQVRARNNMFNENKVNRFNRNYKSGYYYRNNYHGQSYNSSNSSSRKRSSSSSSSYRSRHRRSNSSSKSGSDSDSKSRDSSSMGKSDSGSDISRSRSGSGYSSNSGSESSSNKGNNENNK